MPGHCRRRTRADRLRSSGGCLSVDRAEAHGRAEVNGGGKGPSSSDRERQMWRVARTFISPPEAASLSKSSCIACLANKGVPARHDLDARESPSGQSRKPCHLDRDASNRRAPPEGDSQILCRDVVRVCRGWLVGDGEVAERAVKQVLKGKKRGRACQG